MKKSLVIVFISLILITSIMSIGFVSATWFGDFWKKLTGKTTENDTTTPTCSDECSSNGAKQCSGDGYKTCENYDSDSCLEFSSVTSCSSGETCVAGACVSNTYVCTDSDGGKTYSTKGNVVASSPTSSIDVTDLCSDSNKLVEYFCNSDKTQSGETYTCPNGCSNGACVSATNTTNQTNQGTWCTDSDGGKNYNVKGNSYYGPVGSSTPISADNWDFCSSVTGSLAEYFCVSNVVSGVTYATTVSEWYPCPKGCSNGACVSSAITNQTNTTTSSTTITTTNQTNATTSSTTTATPTISATKTTTTTSATGSGTGSSGSSSSEIEVFEETISIKEEIIGDIKSTEEIKKIRDKIGNEINIKIHTRINDDGSSIVKEERTFINKNGKEVKIEIKTEVKADGSATLERKIRINENEIKSELKILEKFEDDEVKLKAQLSNGNEQEIKIMPDEASEIALEKLKSKGFNIELKEVGEGDNLRVVYIAKEDKDGRLFGLFKIRLNLEAQIDSETGEILSSEKPWWNFLVIKIKPIGISESLGNQTNQTNITLPGNQTGNNTIINQTGNWTCTDSDGGKTYSTKGNVVATSPTSFINVTDLCSSSSVLIEYFCINLQQSGETHTCPNGCSNGACI